MLKYNACAHAQPHLRPFVPLDCKDHDPVFPVSPCCSRSVRYKVAEPRSYISALPDRDRCEDRPMFTDPDTLVHIQADTFRADIYLDRLCDLTITNTRSLIQTGQLNWPIWVLGGAGLVLVALGGAMLVKKKRENNA